MCEDCGRSGHSRGTCHLKKSKYFNSGGGAYIDSKAYQFLKLDKPSYTDIFLSRDFSKPHVPSTSTSSSSSSVKQSNNAQAQKRRSKLLASLVCSECTLNSPDPISHFVSFMFLVFMIRTSSNKEIKLKC